MKSVVVAMLGAASIVVGGTLTTTTTLATTTSTAAATTTTAAGNHGEKDIYTLNGLQAWRKGTQHDVTFEVKDWSTYPVESTNCHLSWHGKHVRRGPIKCEDGWFTAMVDYFDDVRSFGLTINHAYGETCEDCNDEVDADYDGDVGTCAIMLDEDKMGKATVGKDSESATAKKPLKCFVDFDD